MFAFIPAFARKAIPLAFAGLLLAACQSSGLKPGAMTTVGFPPAGWETVHASSNETLYICRTACKKEQLVLVGPLRDLPGAESDLRQPAFRTTLLDAYLNVIEEEEYGDVQFDPSRKSFTNNFANLELSGNYTTKKGRAYFSLFVLTQGDRRTGVLSLARDKATAARNIKLFGQNTRVVRIP